MRTLHLVAVLKSLEPAKQRSSGDGMEVAGDVAASTLADLEEHVLPGGVGTFSIRQVPEAQLREESVAVSRVEVGHAAGSVAVVHSAPSTMWQDSGIDKRSRGKTIGTPVFPPFSKSHFFTGSHTECYYERSGSRAEGRSSGSSADQEPNSPRSKHSATEQRRRTKINDRQANSDQNFIVNCSVKNADQDRT